MAITRSCGYLIGAMMSLAMCTDGFTVSTSRIQTFGTTPRVTRRRIGKLPSIPSLSLSLQRRRSDSASNGGILPFRAQMRKLTGFSLTAVRATIRAISGISASAIYASTLAMSGAWIRQSMKAILSIFPSWMRYFVQPFLVLYYAPLFFLHNLASPTRKNARLSHENFVEGWKKAVQVADGRSQYWPLHVNNQGDFESDIRELDMNDAIAESAFLQLEMRESEKDGERDQQYLDFQ